MSIPFCEIYYTLSALRTLVQYVIVDSGLPKKPTTKDLWVSLLIGMRIWNFGSILPVEAKRQGIDKEGGDNAKGSTEPQKENHQQNESVGDSYILWYRYQIDLTTCVDFEKP